MMFTIVQFSPTGNTAYISRLLSKQLNVTHVHALEHTESTTLDVSQHLIILFPIHGFNAPNTVVRFVRALPHGKSKMCSLIGVGCTDLWINFGASQGIRKILVEKSYRIIVDETIAMPSNFVVRFPDKVVKHQLEKASKTIETLANHIINGVVSHKVIPFKSRLLSKIGKIEPVAAKFFGLELYAKKNCVQCGLCVKECPQRNIKLNERGKIKFGFNCTMCMRCIYNCPQKSITPRISKFIPLKHGYSIEKFVSKD